MESTFYISMISYTNNGAHITMVSKNLGHSNSSETLNTYSHLFNTTASEGINTINQARNTVKN